MAERRTVFLPGRPGLYRQSDVRRCFYCGNQFASDSVQDHEQKVCSSNPRRKAKRVEN